MKLSLSISALQVCCSVFWVVTSTAARHPPECDSSLTFLDVAPSSEGDKDIHSHPLSPWRWRPSTVRNRIPATLWEAECRSNDCSSLNPGHRDKLDLNSVPVYQNILVLNKKQGGRCYTASFHSVAVGCTCIRAKINHS